MQKTTIITLLFISMALFQGCASDEIKINENYVTFSAEHGIFSVYHKNEVASVVLSENDFSGVQKVADMLAKDLEKITGILPEKRLEPGGKSNIIIGTIGQSRVIDDLIENGKLDVSDIEGKWETFLLRVIDNNLVIAGSDKRGTIYGIFDLSERMGVSPWYWWADVPVQKRAGIYIKSGIYSNGTPGVKYRGIFLNDEEPALGNWTRETFGDFNHLFYDKVCELILRSKGNFLWPAMWGKAFYDDDSLNAVIADEYGVVIGTSHHEPLARAHVEWNRYGEGSWNYEKNEDVLQGFWRTGMERMGDYEGIVTIGMRGDGDEAMTEGTAIELLETIVKDQREIIADVTGKPAEETPQVWALYKEVQEYYNKGMRVPDDVTLFLCDDNWGNVRVVPKEDELGRKGGFGMYYHFDFVGGPVSYKWQNVTQIEKVWEQMNLTYEHGVKEIWLVNVGDLKPMELPISFFLDLAWNPESIVPKDIPGYYTKWAIQQFGKEYAREIGEILSLYTKYNARRNPEMLKPETYSLVDYREAERVVYEYKRLEEKADKIYKAISAEYKDAYYQLVYFPVAICANLNEMYLAAGKNRLYKKQGRTSTNKYAEMVAELFERDSLLTLQYHTELANGKWNHMMSQTHIGYTTWSDPRYNIMPEVERIDPTAKKEIGIAIEGKEEAFVKSGEDITLPVYDPINKQEYYVEVFNKSDKLIDYQITSENKWIVFSSTQGNVELEDRILISVNWMSIPKGTKEGVFTVTSSDQAIEVRVPVQFPDIQAKGFVENNGVVSINAASFSRAVSTHQIKWQVIPNMGRTHSSVTAMPTNAPVQEITEKSPRLEYKFSVFEPGEVTIEMLLSPTLNFKQSEGLVYGISIDDEGPQLVNMHEDNTAPDWTYPNWWNMAVTDKVMKEKSTHTIDKAGMHTLKVYLVDPGIVFQKIIIDTGGAKPSYLGPPESKVVE